MGTGDNDDFMSTNGGKSWGPAWGGCGDCGAWFADPAIANRVTELAAPKRKGQALFIYTNPGKDYPTTYDDDNRIVFPYPDYCIFDTFSSRPLILTPPPASAFDVVSKYGEYITIREIGDHINETGYHYFLLKAKPGSGDGSNLWLSQGSELPCACRIYQASMDTYSSAPVIYISDGKELWKGIYSVDGQQIKQWIRIVPGAGAETANRFFVNPYNPSNIYIVDNDKVKRTDNGGNNWNPDVSLDSLLSANGEYSYQCYGDNCILNDLIVNRTNLSQRFAVGIAGVFYTNDSITWHRLMDTNALPCRPVSAFFDAVSDPDNKALYVACNGRGILKIYLP